MSSPPSTHHTHLPSLYHDGSEDSLKALIHARQQSRGAQMDNFSDSLEQKYAKKQKGSSKAGGRTRHHMEKKQDIMHDITVTCVVLWFSTLIVCLQLYDCLISPSTTADVHEQLTLFPTLSNTSIWKYCNMQLGMKNHSHLGMYVKLHKHHHPGLCTGNHPWECTQNDRILDVCMCVGHHLVPREMARLKRELQICLSPCTPRVGYLSACIIFHLISSLLISKGSRIGHFQEGCFACCLSIASFPVTIQFWSLRYCIM